METIRRTKVVDLLKREDFGAMVNVKGWVRTRRGSKQVNFIALNDGSTINNVQVVVDLANFDEEMLKQITTGACLSVNGELVKSVGSGQAAEIQAREIEVLGVCDNTYPLQKKGHSMEFLREIAHLRPRTNTFGAVFRIRHNMAIAIHKFFHERGFFYFHTPLITASDCEGAGQMFQVTTMNLYDLKKDENGSIIYDNDFFGKQASLTVSGQLEGELAATALGAIYTFGPTFRAENSNTPRHLAEFWMIEPEVAFNDINDNMDLAEEFIKYCVQWALDNCYDDVKFLNDMFDKGLIERLQGVLKESHYSKDTQSDYVGALCTRVKSLTNGIYGSVFCAEDALSDAELFDCNVVVDLSRVGSMETKSLLMGILVMKLQEYRMCGSEMNSRLRHVTVLEEAHNLLRKTSAEQSQEGANLQGKSVEMLANAIAEMRTYGEGFIIADQAPGLLDMSVIRNTNTKIILRLPDEEDRKLVGKSAALKEAQIDELSKLPLGVAAVYQNEWPEAVLCKIEAYPMPENAVYHKPSKMPHEINAEFVFGQLAVGKELEPLSISEMEQLKLWLKRHEMMLKPEDGRYLEQVFAGGELDVAKTRKAVFDFFGGISTVVDYCAAAEKSFTPRKEFLEQLQGQYGLKAAAADWVLNSVISMGMSLNPDAKAVENLRTNFEQQGGRVL